MRGFVKPQHWDFFVLPPGRAKSERGIPVQLVLTGRALARIARLGAVARTERSLMDRLCIERTVPYSGGV